MPCKWHCAACNRIGLWHCAFPEECGEMKDDEGHVLTREAPNDAAENPSVVAGNIVEAFDDMP